LNKVFWLDKSAYY